MPILDAQVHAYERNHPDRPWIGTLYGPAERLRARSWHVAVHAERRHQYRAVDANSIHGSYHLVAGNLCGAPDPLQAGQAS